jgi:twitching motility protein PilT
MATLPELLKTLVDNNGSDLHITTNTPPQIRVHGHLRPLDLPPLGPAETKALAYSVLTDSQKKRFEESLELDFSFGIRNIARFRCNVFNQRGAVAAVYRVIPEVIKSFNELGLPQVIGQLAERPRGLVLVTGPTGSGKSTTLAAMVDYVNRNFPVHVLTIEDPIEFVHTNQKALVTQREVGSHAAGFQRALRAALREDPDVILVGEMRDPETVQLALEAGNTGHLVFSTLHSSSAATTVDRIVDLFEPSKQEQIRSSLGETLLGVVSQSLCRRIGGGRVAALEVLVVNHAVANLIREGKTSQLTTVMQTGRAEGNRLMNVELAALVKSGVVTREEALSHSTERKELERLLGRPGETPPAWSARA